MSEKVLVVMWKDTKGNPKNSEVLESYFDSWLEDNKPSEHNVIGKKDGFGKQFR